jgi:hemerythrin superfamily protein
LIKHALLRPEPISEAKWSCCSSLRETDRRGPPPSAILQSVVASASRALAGIARAASLFCHGIGRAVTCIIEEIGMEATKQDKTETGPGSQNALDFLQADHRSVEKLFDAFKKTADDDVEAKAVLAQRACEALSIHTMIEEELLYPAAQEALPDGDTIDVEEAYIEHFLVKTLIAKFETMKVGDKGFDATFKVMSEMVLRHVEEEENQLFPELRNSKCDLRALGDKLAQRKTELQSKLDAVGSRSVGDKTTML